MPLIIWSKHLLRSAVLPPSRSLPRCGWMAFALPWLSMCLFSGLSDRRSILHGGVASLPSRIFSCRWSGWLLDEYLRACQNRTIPTFTSAARLLSHASSLSVYCNVHKNTHLSMQRFIKLWCLSWRIWHVNARLNPNDAKHPFNSLCKRSISLRTT